MSFASFACFTLFQVSHPSAWMWLCLHSCAHLYYKLLSDVIRVHLLVYIFSLCHNPVHVFVCVCSRAHAVPFFLHHFSSDAIWSLFFFLVSHPSASVCVSLCMGVPFFLHHYSSDVIAVHSLVIHYSSGHIQCMSLSVYVRVCVFVCMAMPIFFTFIHLMSFHSICMCVTFPGSTSQYKCFVCVYVHGFALLLAPLSA